MQSVVDAVLCPWSIPPLAMFAFGRVSNPYSTHNRVARAKMDRVVNGRADSSGRGNFEVEK